MTVPDPARSPSAQAPAPSAATSVATSGTQPRWADRRKSSAIAKTGMIIFAIGLVALAVSLVLFATGKTDLPLWLNLISMLTAVGLGIGLFGVVREARAASPALIARQEAKAARKDAAGS